jgi:hypothetical protein
MTRVDQRRDYPAFSAFKAWLDRPLARWHCVMGWILSFSVFAGLVAILGGPTPGDATTSIYSTWAIAHGSFSCAYPHVQRLAAPLYPLLTGALDAILRLGDHVAFPGARQFGPHCSTAFAAIDRWSTRAHVLTRTLQLGDLSWFALMGGLVALLRTTGRGRTGWEPFALGLVALSPPVLMPLTDYFHPMDILAMGLALGALAALRRDAWIAAGLLIGLAYVSQQYALLIGALIFIVAPAGRRLKFSLAALVIVCAIGIPLLVLTSGRALRAILVGTGFSPSFAATVLNETGLHGSVLTDVARAGPLLVTVVLVLWVVRRIGAAALAPDILVALLALSLSLRLVFEVDLWGYYFMPLSVSLLLLDVMRGHVRSQTIAWLALVTLVFNPVQAYVFPSGRTYGLGTYYALAIAFLVVALLLIVLDALHRRVRWHLVAWTLLVVVTSLSRGWIYQPSGHAFPLWFWQIVLLASAISLAMGPLLSRTRIHAALGQ